MQELGCNVQRSPQCGVNQMKSSEINHQLTSDGTLGSTIGPKPASGVDQRWDHCPFTQKPIREAMFVTYLLPQVSCIGSTTSALHYQTRLNLPFQMTTTGRYVLDRAEATVGQAQVWAWQSQPTEAEFRAWIPSIYLLNVSCVVGTAWNSTFSPYLSTSTTNS